MDEASSGGTNQEKNEKSSETEKTNENSSSETVVEKE